MNAVLGREPVAALVGVDEREPSDFAVAAAFRLRSALKLSIEMVHAAPVPLDYFAHLDPLGVERARAAAAERWKEHIEHTGLPLPRDARTIEIVPGKPADVLLERAAQREAGLIVLGRHEKRATLDFGDVVRDVVVRAECPVWVQAGAPRAIQRILCPIDIGGGGLRVLELARDVARALGAEIVALHCFVRPQLGFVLGYPVQFPGAMIESARESAEREFRQLLEPFDWRGVVHRRLFYEADPASEIVALQHEFDLVVLGTHGRRGVAKALLGSVAGDLLRKAEVPALVMRCASA